MAVNEKALAAAAAPVGAAEQPPRAEQAKRDYAKEENDAYAKLQDKRREVRTNVQNYKWGG